jgi:hypothetical protein
MRENPQGRPEWVPNPNIPPIFAQALAMTGYTAPSGLAMAMPQVGGRPINGVVPLQPVDGKGQPVPQPGQTVELSIGGQTIGQSPVDAGGRWSIPAPPGGPREQPRTIFQALDVTAGPFNKALGITRRAFGEFGPDAGSATVQNAPMVEGYINRMIQFFDGDGRLLAAEREDLKREVGKLDPTLLSKTGAKESAYGMDVVLERVMDRAMRTANDPNLGANDTNNARKLYADLEAIRRELGVVRPKSQAELKQAYLEGRIDLGGTFFMPDGTPEEFDQAAFDFLFKGKK